MTQQGRQRLAAIVREVLAYRGKSPEQLANSYLPERPPLSAPTVRRIRDMRDDKLDGDAAEMKLLRLAGMLRLPPRSLVLAYRGDVEGVARLEFTEPAVRQVVLDLMSPGPSSRSGRSSRAQG